MVVRQPEGRRRRAWDYVRERIDREAPTVQNATVRAAEVLSLHIGKKFSAIIRNKVGAR